MPSTSNKQYKKTAESVRNAFSGEKSEKKDEKKKDEDKDSFATRVTKGLQALKKKGPPKAKEK